MAKRRSTCGSIASAIRSHRKSFRETRPPRESVIANRAGLWFATFATFATSRTTHLTVEQILACHIRSNVALLHPLSGTVERNEGGVFRLPLALARQVLIRCILFSLRMKSRSLRIDPQVDNTYKDGGDEPLKHNRHEVSGDNQSGPMQIHRPFGEIL